MSEESPVTNPEVFETIDESVEGKKPKKRARKNTGSLPKGLAKMNGADVIEVMDFLHKRYLSWLTEAEASKYTIVYKTAKEEALKETLEITNELLKNMENMLSTMQQMLQKMEEMTKPKVPTVITKKEIQKMSILDDPRIRTTLFAILDGFMAGRKEWNMIRDLVAGILIPEAFEQMQEQGEQQVTKEELEQVREMMEEAKQQQQQQLEQKEEQEEKS